MLSRFSHSSIVILVTGASFLLVSAVAAQTDASCTFKTFQLNSSSSTNPVTWPNGVNDYDTVVGEADFLSSNQDKAFIRYSNGSATYYYPANTVTNAFYGRNNSGVTTGVSSDSQAHSHSFMMQGSTITPIVDPKSPNSTVVRGINKYNSTVGFYIDSNDVDHGFKRYSNGTFNDLNYPASGVNGTQANGINDSGAIVGFYTQSSGALHGFIFSNGSWATLDLPGGQGSQLVGISNAGAIVGTDQGGTEQGRSFMYANGNFGIINAPNSFVTEVTGIAPGGLIVGRTNTDGTEAGWRGFTATCQVSSSAQYLYTSNNGSQNVSGFKINSNGTLAALSGFPVSTGSLSPVSLSAAEDSLLVDACNGTCKLSLYKIGTGTGDLSLSSSTPVQGSSAVLDPSASSAYSSFGTPTKSGTVSAFSVATGNFSVASGSPYQYSISGGSNPVGAPLIALDPSGTLVYMPLTPQNEHTPSGWFGLASRNSDSSLSGFTSYEAGCIGTGTMAVAEEPSNSLVFSSCVDDTIGTYWISAIVVDRATGTVTQSGAGYFDQTSTETLVGLAVDKTGKWLAVTDATNNKVHIMAINTSTGALTDSPSRTFSTGVGPNAAAFDKTGKYLYVTNGGFDFSTGSNDISAYAFNSSTGVLTPLSGSPYATGQSPSDLTIAQP